MTLVTDDPKIHDASGPSTVFVTEPDILIRLAVAAYLRECGYVVLEGTSAADVFTVLNAGRPIDIVLSDVNLSGRIDGFGLARRLREEYPDIDVLLTSGVARTAKAAGDICDEGPMAKPYRPEDVARRIHLMRERHRRRAASSQKSLKST
jgi:DNA-binding response OmpR family regulator